MGKSYRKNPIFKNTTADSDRSGKQIGNRKLRGEVKHALKNYDAVSEDDLVLPEPDEVYNAYNFDSDGKHYDHNVKLKRSTWNRGPDKREIE